MGNNEQINAIKNSLATVDSSIAQAQADLSKAANSDDIRSLTSTLADLRSQRAELQAELTNAQAANG